MDEKYFDPYRVPDAFVEHGKQTMQDKYLVIRRDGTIPDMDIIAGEQDDHEFGPDDPSIVQVMQDARGGRVFISCAWDADQLQREIDKEKGE